MKAIERGKRALAESEGKLNVTIERSTLKKLLWLSRRAHIQPFVIRITCKPKEVTCDFRHIGFTHDGGRESEHQAIEATKGACLYVLHTFPNVPSLIWFEVVEQGNGRERAGEGHEDTGRTP